MCGALGATRELEPSYRRLVALYRTPARAYHNLRHVEHCLAEYDEVRHLAVHPSAVEAALWFHDAVYDSKATDNEEKSAEIAGKMLAAMGVRPALRRTVRKLILHTKHAGVPGTKDGKIVVDIDLAILGASPAVFARYERGIRTEYNWVADSVFRPKRAEFLQSLLNRKRIYATDVFFRKYEAEARKNVSRSIAKVVTKAFIGRSGMRSTPKGIARK